MAKKKRDSYPKPSSLPKTGINQFVLDGDATARNLYAFLEKHFKQGTLDPDSAIGSSDRDGRYLGEVETVGIQQHENGDSNLIVGLSFPL